VSADALVERSPVRLVPDPSRVITRLFVPGHALAGEHEGRVSGVVLRILALDDGEVTASLAAVTDRFAARHLDLDATFLRHADRLADRVAPGVVLSDERRRLLGATFTHEVSVEAAAVCNPSMVAAPDQEGIPEGSLRVVMSSRLIGEGHVSSIGLHGGTVAADGQVTLDPPSPHTVAGTVSHGVLDAASVRRSAPREEVEATSWVLDRLPSTFDGAELEARLVDLDAQRDTRRNAAATVHRLRELAARSYQVSFAVAPALGSRVLFPATSDERRGAEDARFVRFVDDDGSATYHATYTAFDGLHISQQLLTTSDFATFTSSPLLGAAAANKGLALFPRRIGGRFVALSRHDGSTNGIAATDDIRHWPTVTPLDMGTEPWETIQTGNCGSPVETDAGWLVLTHGVGPMREYSIGAVLLDLDDPCTVIGRLVEPLLTPQPDEQDGYVPNVVYSCGALRHGSTLVIPFGIGDANIGFASADIDAVLAAMVDPGPAPHV
jgi:predicted GH43/DUF377 family glycosyl hydrolase